MSSYYIALISFEMVLLELMNPTLSYKKNHLCYDKKKIKSFLFQLFGDTFYAKNAQSFQENKKNAPDAKMSRGREKRRKRSITRDKQICIEL